MNTSSKSIGAQQLAWIWSRTRTLLVILLMIVAFAVGYGLKGVANGDQPTNAIAASDGQQWYTCSMHPDVRLPNPDDKCPTCHMALVPVGSSDSGEKYGPRQIELSRSAQAAINVQTTPAIRRFIENRVNLVGEVDYDETRLAYITSYIDGRLDRLFVDYTGIEVRKGDHLAEIYSPELLVSLAEIREARQSVDRLDETVQSVVRESAEAVLTAARERLRLFGLNEQQIKAAESGAFNGDHITLHAPIGGIVIEKNAKTGSYVKEGDRIYTIADLSKVWVVLEAYESDLAWLRYGQEVTFTVEPFGDEKFTGSIAFIAPTLDRSQRTVGVRVNVDNADGRLRPGMFVRGTVQTSLAGGGRVIAPDLAGKWISPMHPEVVRDQPGECPVCGMDLVKAEELGFTVAPKDATPPLVVPDSAVLRTGKRGIVYVKTTVKGDTVFEGREVTLGPRGEGFFIVESGVDEGDLVVTRGNFQIDSALQIEAKISMMNPQGGRMDTGHEHHGERPPAVNEQAPIAKVHLHGPGAARIRDLLDAYMSLSAALAGDDLPASKTAVSSVTQSIEQAKAAAFTGEFDKQWRPIADRLTKTVAQLEKAKDIEKMRTDFYPLSNEMITLMMQAHIENAGPIYRAHCPMAMSGKGGSWLTNKKEIRNPYFGAQMLQCGDVEQTLSEPDEGGHE